jgi:hypothetical protein
MASGKKFIEFFPATAKRYLVGDLKCRCIKRELTVICQSLILKSYEREKGGRLAATRLTTVNLKLGISRN